MFDEIIEKLLIQEIIKTLIVDYTSKKKKIQILPSFQNLKVCKFRFLHMNIKSSRHCILATDSILFVAVKINSPLNLKHSFDKYCNKNEVAKCSQKVAINLTKI